MGAYVHQYLCGAILLTGNQQRDTQNFQRAKISGIGDLLSHPHQNRQAFEDAVHLTLPLLGIRILSGGHLHGALRPIRRPIGDVIDQATCHTAVLNFGIYCHRFSLFVPLPVAIRASPSRPLS